MGDIGGKPAVCSKIENINLQQLRTNSCRRNMHKLSISFHIIIADSVSCTIIQKLDSNDNVGMKKNVFSFF